MGTFLLNYTHDPNAINSAVNLLKKGDIGVFPTDTVYGIGCDALNIHALEKLYKFKKRNLDKPINVLVADISMVNKFIKNINWIEQKLIDNFWPGALTIVFDKSEIVPDILTAGLPTVGIRMPDNKACLDLINQLGNPIATSSANISDNPTCNTVTEILRDFINKVKFILDTGKIKNGLPSTIVRVENNEIKILREGFITKSDIIKCFGGNINVR